jgi:hypothetical protein
VDAASRTLQRLDAVRTRVVQRGEAHVVTVDPTWSAPPTCTCRTGKGGRDEPGPCAHLVAVLQETEHAGQLLDLLL